MTMKISQVVWQLIKIWFCHGNVKVKTFHWCRRFYAEANSVKYIDYNGEFCEIDFMEYE